MNAKDAIAHGYISLVKAWGDFEAPDGHPKSPAFVEAAFIRYFENWPLGEDGLQPLILGGKPAIEFSFSFPLPGPTHPETGEPFLYTGRADMIGSYYGQPLIVDEKTTGSFSGFSERWNMRGQFHGYQHAARINGYETLGCLVRGILIQKTQTQFMELPVLISDHKIDLWLEQIARHTLPRMIECWKESYFDRIFGDACHQFGHSCTYIEPCTSPDETQWYDSYRREEWKPLATRD